ncbi:DUF6377 domain-containing protein [Chitinophaga sancti]|uniref:DUF6377 domain-containing protein n=1 Tax=Chitinophaga sancti TaxID=1004 RepID=UPI003F7B08F6
MKSYLFIIVFFAIQIGNYAAASDSLLNRLDEAIANKQYYASLKEKRIASYKKLLLGKVSMEEEYLLNEKLYEEYRKFRIDSSLYYVNRNLEISTQLNNPDWQYKSKIQQAYLFSSTGRYLEAESILKSIKSPLLSRELKELYYEFYYRLLEHYTTNNPNETYSRQIEVYRDSLLAVLAPNSDKYRINLAQGYIYKKDLAAAESLLKNVLSRSTSRDDVYAMANYLLGDINMQREKRDLGVDFYTLAAIADVENAINDHGAIQSLSIHFYYNGNIDRAYRYAKSALEDAIFCNVKFRTLMMSEFYSIINAAYQEKSELSRKQLEKYLILISILTLFLGAAIIYVYRQMKKITRVKEALSRTGAKLELLNMEILHANEQLKNSNEELQDSNRVKEEYIAQFFDLCSSYIDKLENYRKMLNTKAVGRQFEEIARILKSTDFTNSELHDLYRNFDLIFIHLYPGFVEELNSLLIPEERYTFREGEILNTELRIFALERLGITDSVRIAAFLRCSISTIYNYRTKARNRSAVSREEFESKVAKIGRRPTDKNPTKQQPAIA